MGSEWVDGGPSLGSALGGMFGKLNAAPGEALSQMALADKIAWDRRTKLAAAGVSAAADAAIPQASVPPRFYTAADISNPAILDKPLSALKPASAGTETLTPGFNQIVDPIALADAQAKRNFALRGVQATTLEHPELWAPQLGLASVAARGPGATQYDRAADTFLTTGRYPTVEESKLHPAQNFTIQNADGTPTGITYSTRDGKTTVDGVPIASLYDPTRQRAVETGSATATPGLDENTAKQRLAIIASNSRDRDLTPEEQFAVQTLAPVAYKASRVVEESGGLKQEKYVHTEEIPAIVAQMMARSGMLRAPGVTADRAAAAQTVIAAAQPAPGAEGPSAPIPPATAAVAAAPIITAEEAARAFNPNTSRVVGELAGDPAKLRDDVVKEKPVVQYMNSIPSFNSIVEAALHPSNASDLNIIYGIAKIMDPESAVLGGEIALARATGTLGEQLRARANQLLEGKGMLDATQRADLIESARTRMAEYNAGKDKVVDYYANTLAPSQRVDPKLVVPPMPEMKTFTREQIIKAGGGAAAPAGPRAARERIPTAPTTPVPEGDDPSVDSIVKPKR